MRVSTFLLKLLLGPVVFLAVCLTPFPGLPRPGQLVLATFLWALSWWFAQPIPLGVTALLPLVLFPALGLMNVTATAGLYGQTIFFWILGLTLLGCAMQKHGLARRFAVGLLGIRGVATTTHRLLFFYMLATGVLSMFVSDAAVVAMMMPIGLSVLAYVRALAGREDTKARSPFANFMALGTLYAAVAGGVGTVAGSPTNVVAVAVLERLTGESIGWFRWMKLGAPLALLLLVIFYFMLRLFFRPEFTAIPGGQEFIREEAAKLGKMNRGEKNVLFIFFVMVALFTLPSIAPIVLGAQDPLTVWLRGALSIWTVPPVVLFLLFAIPTDLRKGEFTLAWKEAAAFAPWNVMLLLAGAVAMTEALGRFGFIEFVKDGLVGFGITAFTLPIIASFANTILTEMASGTATTALLGNILIPAAAEVGFNPAAMAVLLSNVAIGKVFPWSGGPAAVAFASGEIDIKDMIRVGLTIDIVLAATVAGVHLLLAPVF